MATGYTVTPTSLRGLVGAPSLAFVVSAIGGDFQTFDAFTINSSDSSDQVVVASPASTFFGSLGVVGVHTGVGESFQFFLIPGTVGPRTISFTNSTTGHDPASLTYMGVESPLALIDVEVLGLNPTMNLAIADPPTEIFEVLGSLPVQVVYAGWTPDA